MYCVLSENLIPLKKYVKFWIFAMPGQILMKQPLLKSSQCALSIAEVIKDLYQSLTFDHEYEYI